MKPTTTENLTPDAEPSSKASGPHKRQQQRKSAPAAPAPGANWDQLLSAAQRNDPVSIYRLILQEKVSPNHGNIVQQSALHIASLWGHVEAVGALLRLGADATAKNKISGATPLHCAVQGTVGQRRGKQSSTAESRLDCVRLLLTEGHADPNATDDQGNSPLDYLDRVAQHRHLTDDLVAIRELLLSSIPASTLHRLLDEVDVEGVRTYLEEEGLLGVTASNSEGSNAVNAVDIRSGTPLQHAVSFFLDQQLKRLTNTETQEDPVEADRSSIDNIKKITQLLLKAGGNINATITITSPVESDSPTSGEKQQSTLLLLCVERLAHQQPPSSADENAAGSSNNLFSSVATDVINFLLVDCDADPNATAQENAGGDLGGEDDPMRSSQSHPTPLHSVTSIAASFFGANNALAARQCLEIAKHLSSHSAKMLPPQTTNEGDADNEGSKKPDTAASATVTLLHDASRRGNLPLLSFLLQHAGKDSGGGGGGGDDAIDVNAPGRQGLTPLHFAARSGQVKAAEMLLEAGADVNAKDGRGKTPLDAAISNDKGDVVRLFEAHKCK